MTDDTLVVYGFVRINGATQNGTPVVVRNEDNSIIQSEITKPNGTYQIDCTDFAEGELCLISTNTKVIQFKADSMKTPYRIDIIDNDDRQTDYRSIVV